MTKILMIFFILTAQFCVLDCTLWFLDWTILVGLRGYNTLYNITQFNSAC